MGKNKMTRLLALLLAVACTLTVVLAADWDLNHDGKVNVWDLQLAVTGNKSDAEKAEVLKEALGGKTDELHPVSEKYYEIYSAMGLFNMVKLINEDGKTGLSFKLMNDIDLGGAEWIPVNEFIGIFDGNNKTISNFKITQCGTTTDCAGSMGFFSVVDYDSAKNQSVVKNLHLKDVEITATEDSRYIGLIAGSNRGVIQNCTAVGVVTDTRTKLNNLVYIGTMVGRNNDSKPNGTITVTNALDALEYYDFKPQSGTSTTTQYKAPAKVNSMMALRVGKLEEDSKARKIGLAGYSADTGIIDGTTGKSVAETVKAGGVFSVYWQDITNSSKFDSQTLRDRRTTVAASMYEMSTVEWTPHETLNYYENLNKGTYSKVGGQVYRGLPYNHGSSSIYRFLSYMDVNADGRYQTKTSVPTEGYYFNDGKVIAEVNDALKAGATTTASGKPISSLINETMNGTSQFGFMQYIGADCSSQALMAWRTVNATSGTDRVTATHTATMYMCNEYIKSYGIVPVNNFILPIPTKDLDGVAGINNSGDKSLMVKEFTRANKTFYMESLGCVTKGDLLMDYTDEGGHTLMAMSDAVVIRNYNGVMDLDKSYIVTAEQGGGGGTRKGTTADGKSWSSTCCVDEVNSFNTLFDSDDKTGYPRCFFPITCAALQDEDTPAAKVTIKLENGIVKSNFQIISSTVKGETVYAQIKKDGHRGAYTSLDVAAVHTGIAEGDTVQVLLANGETYEFTYTAPAAQ